MTLNQLIYFQKLAAMPHMGKAAAELYISQPSLSIAISKLEKEIGLPLFERNGHQLLLNHAGMLFLTHVEKILRELEEASIHMKALTDEGKHTIRIGCVSSVVEFYLSSQMQSFQKLAGEKSNSRDILFELTTDTTPELIRKLKNGVLDLLICSEYEDEGIRQMKLLSHQLVMITNRQCTFIPQTWDEYEGLPFIGYSSNTYMNQYITDLCAREHFYPDIRFHVPDEKAIIALVSQGFGYAIVPKIPTLDNKEINCYELPSKDYYRDLYLTTGRTLAADTAAARFMNHLLRV